MGIKGLMKLITEYAPDAVKECEMANFTGRKVRGAAADAGRRLRPHAPPPTPPRPHAPRPVQVAIDASMAMYQFLIAVRAADGASGVQAQLTNSKGDVTSHVQGMFNRTIRMLEAGIKPCYIFDGKPPTMKGGELALRRQKRLEAEAGLKAAVAAGNVEEQNKFSGRLVKVLLLLQLSRARTKAASPAPSLLLSRWAPSRRRSAKSCCGSWAFRSLRPRWRPRPRPPPSARPGPSSPPPRRTWTRSPSPRPSCSAG